MHVLLYHWPEENEIYWFYFILFAHVSIRCRSMLIVHVACSCCMSMLNVYALYMLLVYAVSHSPCFMSILNVHPRAVCPCCKSMLLVHAACPCCVYMLGAHVSMLNAHAACSCCTSMLLVHAARSCCMFVPIIHHACSCWMPSLHANAACTCFMSCNNCN